MGSYPHVNPGDVFKPSVQEENDIRDLLNAVGRDGVRSVRGGMNVENICINAYNPGTEAISSGTVVIFADAPMIEGAVQVVAMSEEDGTAEWAIAQEEIPAHGFGSVLVMGVTIVPISGEETGDYVVPNGGGATFSKSANGIAKILRMISSTSAMILVGCSSVDGISYVAGRGIDVVQLNGGTISTSLVQGEGITISPVSGSTVNALSFGVNLIEGSTNVHINGSTIRVDEGIGGSVSAGGGISVSGNTVSVHQHFMPTYDSYSSYPIYNTKYYKFNIPGWLYGNVIPHSGNVDDLDTACVTFFKNNLSVLRSFPILRYNDVIHWQNQVLSFCFPVHVGAIVALTLEDGEYDTPETQNPDYKKFGWNCRFEPLPNYPGVPGEPDVVEIPFITE